LITKARSPREAFELARQYAQHVRPDWHNTNHPDPLPVKEMVMLEVLKAKFTQHANLRAMLVSTGNCRLIERTSNDNYWGDGGNGTGQNRLGFLLEHIRTLIYAGQI